MLFRTKRCFAAGLAALIAAAAMMTPASAALSDENGDGVVNVFDYVLSKRAMLQGTAPVNLSVSGTEAAPGEFAVVYVDLEGLSGYAGIDLTLHYAEGLTPAAPDDGDIICVYAEPESGTVCDAELLEDTYSIRFAADCAFPTEEDAALFSVSFLIPEETEIGTVLPLSLSDVQITNADGAPLAVLTEFGSVTVCEPYELPQDPPPVTEIPVDPPATDTEPAVTTTTASAPVTTTTTAATTVTTVSVSTSATTQTTASETTAATTTTFVRKGIDVSQYQGNINFKKVAADENGEFAVLRAGYGRYLKQEDPKFRTYYDDAKAAGIPVGAYWFSYAKTPEQARIEANVCMQVLGDRAFEYPIALDIETEYQATKLTQEEVSAIIDAFCSEVQAKGYYVVIYSFSSFLKKQVSAEMFRKYDVWVAHTNVSKPSFSGNYGAWQYSWTGSVDGISTDVDLDYCYRDYPAIMQRKHLNGY
ncbi:MAG: hypothetical protein IJ060_01430 [Oscillospiraceae bacterium]|nr:hypothetical protein [Oscillospiraceae bacterium]